MEHPRLGPTGLTQVISTFGILYIEMRVHSYHQRG
jgi:hypothetical protein